MKVSPTDDEAARARVDEPPRPPGEHGIVTVAATPRDDGQDDARDEDTIEEPGYGHGV